MHITNLLFDFGGVLVDLDRERSLRAFETLGFDARPFLGDFGQQGIFSRLESGRATVAELCDTVRQMAGQPDMKDTDIVQAFEQFLVGIPSERLDCLLRLKQRYHIFLLSNTNPIHWRMAREELFRYKGLGVIDFFEKAFLSFQIGIEKPAPGIFRAVADAGLDPAATLFLDDSETNCEAARREGFHAHVAPQGGGWMAYFNENNDLCIS